MATTIDNEGDDRLYRARELRIFKNVLKNIQKLEKTTLPKVDTISQLTIGRTHSPLLLGGIGLEGIRQLQMQMRQRMLFIRMIKLILASGGLIKILSKDWFKLSPAQRKALMLILERKRQIWEFILHEMRRANETAIARSNPDKSRAQLGLTSLSSELDGYLARIREGRIMSKGAWVTQELEKRSFEITGGKKRGREKWTGKED